MRISNFITIMLVFFILQSYGCAITKSVLNKLSESDSSLCVLEYCPLHDGNFPYFNSSEWDCYIDESTGCAYHKKSILADDEEQQEEHLKRLMPVAVRGGDFKCPIHKHECYMDNNGNVLHIDKSDSKEIVNEKKEEMHDSSLQEVATDTYLSEHSLLWYDVDQLGAFEKESFIANLEALRESDKREVLSRVKAELDDLLLGVRKGTIKIEVYNQLEHELLLARDRALRDLNKRYDKKINDVEHADLYQEITDHY